MLAFVGAITCIIASIALCSPGAVPGAEDENGASPSSQGGAGAVHGAEPGAVQGPEAGAVQGAESGVVQVAEVGKVGTTPGKATLFHPGQASVGSQLVQGGMLGPEPFPSTASRFLCLPLAQDCPSPSAREDLLLLRTTAAHLRLMVSQQEGQMAQDQETIRELTVKLSRCEGGQGPSSFQNHPEGDPWEGGEGSEQMVLELERTIHSLKDSIANLEGELLARGNISSTMALPGALRGHLYLKVQELEAQLLAKLSELEKERSFLQSRSERQRQQLEEQLESLHQRIDHLEKETAVYKLQEGYKISFPVRTNYMYARLKGTLPELFKLTICLWLRTMTTAGIGTPFSYAVSGQANELVLLERRKRPMELLVNNKVARLPLEFKDGEWHHLCVTWTTRDGVWEAYQDGTRQGSGDNLAPWHPIKPGGTLVLGQEQDVAGGRYDATQAFVGELAEFNVWDRILTAAEIQRAANCSSAAPGNVLSWGASAVELFGGASKWPFQRCREHKDSKEN